MDTSKFFNRKSSIRNPKVPYKKGKSIEESSNYKSRIFSRVKETKTVKTLLNIRTSVFRIENLLKANSDLENKSAKVQQKYKLIELQEEKDKKKKSKPSKSSGLGNIIQRPKTGAMDMIKNFVTYTFLGWLFTTLQPLISKLEVLGPILQGAFDFLGGTVKFLLDGFASFVKFGYDTKDFITKKSDEIKQQAQGLKQNFDNTLAELKNVVDGTVDAVASYLEIVDKNLLAQAQQQSGGDLGSGIPPLPPVPSTDASTYRPTIPAPQFGPVKGVSTGGVIGYAEGGRIDPRSPVTRGVPQEDEQKKKLLFPPQTTQSTKTNPGADVGGEQYIKKLYKENDSPLSHFEIVFGRNEKSSVYSALLKSSEEYKKPVSKPLGDLGLPQLMGAINDASLGQKPAEKTYENLATGLQYVVDYSRNDPENFNKIDLKQMLKSIIEPKIDKTLDLIRQQVNISARETPPGGGGSPTGGGGSPTGGDGENYKFKAGAPGSKELQEEVEKAAQELGIPAPDLMGVILAESGGDPAKTNQFGCTGLIQFCPGKSQGQAVVGKTGDQLKRMSISEQMKYVIKYLKAAGVKPGMSGYDIYSAIHAGSPGKNIRDRNGVTTKGYYESNVKPLIENARKFSVPVQPEVSVQPGMFKPILGDSGKSQGSKPLSVPYSPFTSSQGNPRISSAKGWRWGREHKGLDIEADPGTPMYSYLPGKIVFSGYAGGYGNRVEWKDSNGNIHSYSHMESTPGFRVGQKIEQGQLIGYVGSTGSSYGPHLHWEIQNSRGSYLDPVQWTKQNPLPKPKEIKLAKQDGKEGIIVDGKWEPKQWTADERKKFNDAKTPQAKVNPTPNQLKDLKSVQNKIRDMKPGDPPLVIPGVGKVIIKKNEKGTVIKEYYDSNNKLIGSDKFFDLVRNPSQQKQSPPQQRKTPRGRSGASRQTSQVSQRSGVKTYNSQTYFKSGNKYYEEIPGRGVFEIPKEIYDMVPVKKKYGGLVYKPGTTPVLPEQKYASYNDPFNNGIIAIQPIYIQQPVPVPVGGGSGGMIAFATPKVNNMDNYQQLMRE